MIFGRNILIKFVFIKRSIVCLVVTLQCFLDFLIVTNTERQMNCNQG